MKLVLGRIINMIKTMTLKDTNLKRRKNLLLSEMKTSTLKIKTNSPKRERNILINAYKVMGWKNNDK